MFREPCCEANPVALPDAVAHHAELTDGYFSVAGQIAFDDHRAG
ncbi:MAG: hypothetical protein OEO77_13640 [Acidimicrobiia bacterium]|nr:hypothetical protein [Acidimicrobiia bacterium]